MKDILDTVLNSSIEAMSAKAIVIAVEKSWAAIHDRCVKGDSSVDVEKYAAYCHRQMHIKTLASAVHNTSVHVDDLYVPLVLNGLTDIAIRVEDHTLIEHGDRLVIIRGFAGRGKSTILRKLLSNHLRRQPSTFPIFYELKNYDGGDIELALTKAMRVGGASLNEEDITRILQDSSSKLFLDAFDEVSPKFHAELVEQIEKLHNKYNCRVICTTRPETELDTVTDVTTYEVSELDDPTIKAIIYKTTKDTHKSKQLCAALDNSRLHSSSETILKSPILVVLYCVSYNMGQDIPDSLGEFYDNIFDAVFSRHDNLKGRVHRERIHNDNRSIYRLVFDTLSFLSLQSNANVFTEHELNVVVGKALEYLGEDVGDAGGVSKELRLITNLIIQDGFNNYRYVHKSIQEFFAASFVRALKQSKTVDFYKRCVEDSQFYRRFGNTLFFLQEIDYFNYSEHFFVPYVRNDLGISAPIDDSYRPSEEIIEKFLSDNVFEVVVSSHALRKGGPTKTSYDVSGPFYIDREASSDLLATLFSTTYELIKPKLGSIDSVVKVAISDFLNQVKSRDMVMEVPLGNVIEKADVDGELVCESFTLAVGLKVAQQFNLALRRIAQRTYADERSGLLDF